MKKIGAYEAKTRLSSILEQVRMGESYAITKRGQLVAVLSPAGPAGGRSVEAVAERLKALRQKLKLGAPALKDLIQKGRP